MENASKALLIAAAVLIVILLVAFAMKMFSSTENVSGKTTEASDIMSVENASTAIDIQFSKYSGEQKGTVVKQMLKEVAEYNKTHGKYGVPGDTTTNYVRKIAVGIQGAGSNTGWNVISGTYYNSIEDEKIYIVRTMKNRGKGIDYESHIYRIEIKPK